MPAVIAGSGRVKQKRDLRGITPSRVYQTDRTSEPPLSL